MRGSEQAQYKHLQTLGLPAACAWQAVQSRYRRLVLAHHPDLNPGNSACAERFRRIAEAYEALAAIQRRRQEDSPEGLERMRADPRLRSLSMEELSLRLRYSSSAWVRAAAADLLGQSPASRGLLKAALKDSEKLVRRSALQALSRIGKPGDLLRHVFWSAIHRGIRTGNLLEASARIWRRAMEAWIKATIARGAR